MKEPQMIYPTNNVSNSKFHSYGYTPSRKYLRVYKINFPGQNQKIDKNSFNTL